MKAERFQFFITNDSEREEFSGILVYNSAAVPNVLKDSMNLLSSVTKLVKNLFVLQFYRPINFAV